MARVRSIKVNVRTVTFNNKAATGRERDKEQPERLLKLNPYQWLAAAGLVRCKGLSVMMDCMDCMDSIKLISDQQAVCAPPSRGLMAHLHI